MKEQNIIHISFSLFHLNEGFYSFVRFLIRCKGWNFSSITKCNWLKNIPICKNSWIDVIINFSMDRTYRFYSSKSKYINRCTRNLIYKKRIHIIFLWKFYKTFIHNKNSVFIIWIHYADNLRMSITYYIGKSKIFLQYIQLFLCWFSSDKMWNIVHTGRHRYWGIIFLHIFFWGN